MLDAATTLERTVKSVSVSSICSLPYRAPLRDIHLTVSVPVRTTIIELELRFFVVPIPMMGTPTVVKWGANVHVQIRADGIERVPACALVH